MKASVKSKRWKAPVLPKKILVIRFQALGDTIITLPYLQSIREKYPTVKIHLLTREEVSDIPKSIELFEKVITIGGHRNTKRQLISALSKLPMLWAEHYDAVIDLQNHKISKVIRRLLQPAAWTEFDKYSSISAGERTRQTIESLCQWQIGFTPEFSFKSRYNVKELLAQNGYKTGHKLIVLNPAGYCPSRSWPIKNYAEFAANWLQRYPMTQFVLLLLPVHKEKANYLKAKLGDQCVDLTGLAKQVEAFLTIQMAQLVLSEDSGLMHMAWTQGIPTIALFSSSRKDWSAPQGDWSECLDSSDLACGPCTLEICKFNDNRCLTRYDPEFIVTRALKLLSSLS